MSHARPTIKSEEEKLAGELTLPNGTMLRRIALLDGGRGWKVEDAFLPSNSGIRVETEVFWQLAPNAAVEQSNSRSFRLRVGSVALTIECSDAWQSIEVGTETKSAPSTAPESSLHGLCSSAFRRVERGPCLLLRGRAEGEKRLVTQFRAES